ncbi:hypothetical protein F4861DRAFT_231089 [Xylaria intraflava]|nr:hypothetical protein F4861DRAFT_231089 [Xylaria intraflava]
MRFATGTLISLGLVAAHALPLTSTTTEPAGCRVDLTPTLSQPEDAAENILYSTITKWENTAEPDSYFTSDYLDTQNTTHAPFFVIFKAGVIPHYESTSTLGAILDTWMGTYLIGGATPTQDDYAITGVTCS